MVSRPDDTENERAIQNLFLAALEVPDEELGSFLDAHCQGEPELRSIVEERLRQDRETLSRLAPLGLPRAVFASNLEGDTVAGERSYRLLYELGQGGMGSVWLAERADGEFRQKVAIKMLARERRPDLILRFRTERQILAALDHPSIAKLLDGGTLPNGTPYLVMEYVDGVRIDDYCRAQGLSLRARVELFLEVCAAVGVAHQRLIVHRDLKPGNILVNREGIPKLLDFGIAKLLDQGSFGMTVAETELGFSPLTLRYASPEQVMGEPLDTTSDVYSLGVILFELLTGQSPYGEGPELSTAALAHRICSEEPPRPSQKVEAPHLKGDLDAIVLMALRKGKAARYASVAALAEDLRRWLDGFPVLARKGSRAYAAGKFLRRHRWALAALSLLIATLATSAFFSWRQARALEAERDRVVAAEKITREKEEMARRVTGFLVEILQSADPRKHQGREPSVSEVLNRGADRVERELAGQPELQAALLEEIGPIYASLGRHDRSRAAFEQAAKIRRRKSTEDPGALAECLSRWSLTENGAGRYEEAEKLIREAIALRNGTGDPLWLRDRRRLGKILTNLMRLDEAQAELEVVLAAELAATGFAGLPLQLEGRQIAPSFEELLTVLADRGHVAAAKGDHPAAVLYYGESLRLIEALHGKDHSLVATMLVSLVGPLVAQKKEAEALAAIDRAIAINRVVYGPRHPRIAIALVNRAGILGEMLRWNEVLETAKQATEIAVESLGPDHPATFAAENNQGVALARLGRKEEALALGRKTLTRCRAVGNPDLECEIVGASMVGSVLRELGRFEESEAELEKAVEYGLRVLPPDHPWRLSAEAELVKTRARQSS